MHGLGVRLVECLNEIIRVEVAPRNPLVVRIIVAFPLDEVFGALIADMGVQTATNIPKRHNMAAWPPTQMGRCI